MAQNVPALIDVQSISKFFGSVIALKDISMICYPGEVMCLLGDNGAGKSTLIKTLSGVHKPDEGQILLDGQVVNFNSPRDALDNGIATVYQDLAMVSLMSVTRNFFMGREPTKGSGLLQRFMMSEADTIAQKEMADIGIDVRDPTQAVGTMSGGERQCLAIARAVYFGAKVLILDEPTSALGVKQASVVLKYIAQAKARNLGVIFITHNVHHAYPVADCFTILNRGHSLGTFEKSDVSREDVLGMMAGGKEMDELTSELEEFARSDEAEAAGDTHPLEATAAAEKALAHSIQQESDTLKKEAEDSHKSD